MANSLSFTPVTSVSNPTNPGILIGNPTIVKVVKLHQGLPQLGHHSRFQSLEAKSKATDGSYPTPATKPRSIVCADCDGNGAIVCNQCEGNGVNSQDHFNGQFKAGALCWLCRGKKEILCGNCNGAGFIGGFMSTFDE